jgi:hypothetical protein
VELRQKVADNICYKVRILYYEVKVKIKVTPYHAVGGTEAGAEI